MYAVLQKNMTRNMSIWDLKNTVVGSWPLKNIFIRFKKKKEGKREKKLFVSIAPNFRAN